jgi:hypothetical protein
MDTHLEVGSQRRHAIAASRGVTGGSTQAVDLFEKNIASRVPNFLRDVSVCHNSQKKLLGFSGMLMSDPMRRRLGDPVNNPRLWAWGSQSTAGHTLCLASIQSVRDTTHSDPGGKLVDGNEGCQGAVGTGAEELRATRSRHGDRGRYEQFIKIVRRKDGV